MSKLSDLLQRANRLTLSTRAIEAEAARRSHVIISHSTISKYLNGRHGEPTHQVLAAMADVFGPDVNTLREAAGMAGVREPFILPDEAARLSPDQRNAVLHVIRVMLDGAPSPQPEMTAHS